MTRWQKFLYRFGLPLIAIWFWLGCSDYANHRYCWATFVVLTGMWDMYRWTKLAEAFKAEKAKTAAVQ